MDRAIIQAIEALTRGEFVIVTDDPDRENEGDLVLAADAMTLEKMQFLLRYTSGVICVPMTAQRLDTLSLPLMVTHNTESHRTAFTISVDLKEGTTTGISAEDRMATVRALADPSLMANQLRRPGHVFPLLAKEGGILKRAGHTEATIDLLRLAGCPLVGVLCELVNPDYSMMRGAALQTFARTHHVPMLSIADLIRYRHRREKLVTRLSSASLPTLYGPFTAYAYASALDGAEHLALVKGEVAQQQNILVRVHSECLTGDIFGSMRCDCGFQLHGALETIAKEGQGVIIYLRGHEGRGIGLGHKLRAYTLQDAGCDTVEANERLGLPIDSREYGIGAQILCDLGLSTIRLITNNPAKYGGLDGYGLRVTERVAIPPTVTAENWRYLKTKQEKMGHLLNLEERNGCSRG